MNVSRELRYDTETKAKVDWGASNCYVGEETR